MSTATKRTIVVAIDGSPGALKGALFSAELAVQCGWRLVLTHSVVPEVVTPANGHTPETETDRIAMHESELMLSLHKDKLNARFPTLMIEVRPLTGKVAAAVSQLADELDADIVMVGAGGLGIIGRFLLGSVADRLVNICNRSVLVVP